MTTYVILNNIPAPSSRRQPAQYPFELLEVGQSFFVPGGQKRSVQQNCRNWSKRLDKKFIADDYTQQTPGGPEEGVMVWRTK